MAIDGMDSWLKKLETLKKDFPKETEKFLMMKTEETIGITKKYTPVDEGTLRNGWQRKKDGKFKQIIFSMVPYVAHVEYGHRIVRNKKTIGYVKGYRMLHKGLNRTKLSFYRDLEVVYKNLISR